jgi:hypothetical protein
MEGRCRPTGSAVADFITSRPFAATLSMKVLALFLSILCALGISACKKTVAPSATSHAENAKERVSFAATGFVRRGLTKFDPHIIDVHEQRYGMSCIPSSVEMVLKLLERVPSSYYDLQTEWKEKSDGNFRNFEGKTFAGVTFHQQFSLARNSDFPLAKLFETIHSELQTGRFVIVGLASSGGWHNWVIYDEDADGEFVAVSKFGARTIEERHVKKVIMKMQGTDIGTYELQPSGS